MKAINLKPTIPHVNTQLDNIIITSLKYDTRGESNIKFLNKSDKVNTDDKLEVDTCLV